MNYKNHVVETGKIPAFDLKTEFEEMQKKGMTNLMSYKLFNTNKSKEVLSRIDDIEKNHNTSWYAELKKRSENEMNAIALFYRGNKITFGEMLKNADLMAKSLKKSGIQKGDEISCCISNTPELVYTMLAASKIGARLTLFGTGLDAEYLENILKTNTNKIFISTDDNYEKISAVVNKCNFEKKLIFSLADSLPADPSKCDEYVEDLDSYYHYENKAYSFKQTDSTIMLKNEFFDYGFDYVGSVEESSTLYDDFLTTFTSGSTKIGRPKQIVHSNRSLIVSGTFNDLEISGSPKIPYQRGLCYIHSDSNTDLITCISDSLMKIWSVACEPEYSRYKSLDVIRINNPSMIEMTTTHLIQMAKDYLKKLQEGVKYKFPNMIATFAVGESTSPGEEKLINKVLRISKAGSEVVVKGIKLPWAPLSVGGGDCEHGGIFYNVFNMVQSAKDFIFTRNKRNGMAPIKFGMITAVKLQNGKYVECDYDEYGILVANSATSMVGYKGDKESTLRKIITTEDGRDWLSCDAYGYIDRAGKIHQKDRVGSEILINNSQVILPSAIADCVLKDSKNIMSCSVTSYKTEKGDIPVVNYELAPFPINNEERTLKNMSNRIKSSFGQSLADLIVFREFNDTIPFPEACSGKRNIAIIEQMGMDRTFKIIDGKKIELNKNELSNVKSKI